MNTVHTLSLYQANYAAKSEHQNPSKAVESRFEQRPILEMSSDVVFCVDPAVALLLPVPPLMLMPPELKQLPFQAPLPASRIKTIFVYPPVEEGDPSQSSVSMFDKKGAALSIMAKASIDQTPFGSFQSSSIQRAEANMVESEVCSGAHDVDSVNAVEDTSIGLLCDDLLSVTCASDEEASMALKTALGLA